MDKTDPICGMQGTIPKHDHWFCSEHCVKTYEKQEGIVSDKITPKTEKDNKWVAYVLIGVILLGGILSRKYGVMIQFMGWFFVVVSILKLLDLKGFSEAYSKYDLIAMKSHTWGWIYPFVELGIGIAFLLNFYVQSIAILTLVLMVIGTIGVGQKLLKNEKFQCACLGTKLNIPLTNLTLIEDVLMGVMSLMILVG